MSMYRKKEYKITLTQKRNLVGYAFVAPFIVGFLLFFLSPVVTSLIFSFSEFVTVEGGFLLKPVGFYNYYDLLRVNPNFMDTLWKGLLSIFINTPLVIIFSFMMANLLNQQFKGRTVCRVIFFLPVVLTSGVMATMSNDALAQMMMGEVNQTGDLDMLASINGVVSQMNLGEGFTDFIVSAASRIYEIVNASGVQILIFLAGLQTVSPSLFESSNIEGATAWENFWKITFPMVSPMILVNLIYTIVDAMSSASARVVTGDFSNNMSFSEGAARSWIFFVCIFVISAVVIGLMSRFVYYEND